MTEPGKSGFRIELGKWGERTAYQFLRRQGYRIIKTSYRTPLGEIDIIARDKGTIAFIEVKTRRSDDYGPPQASVTKGKQHQIGKVASLYLKRNGLETACRFDVVSILANPRRKAAKVELIKDAFQIDS
ncbi:YraN family protein [bacterium]|nr:YraN family protein [bacterium]